jgi:tetratricopeptide (TPR) repeat protein
MYLWGYYDQQIQLYTQILGKIDYEWDLISLNGLGDVYDRIGDSDKAVALYKESAVLASKQGDMVAAALASCKIGVDLNDPHSQQNVMIALEITESFRALSTSRERRRHIKAASNWLQLGQFEGLIETFYHLCQAEQWENARKILDLRIVPDRNKELYEHMLLTGSASQALKMALPLIGNLDIEHKARYLLRLGKACIQMGRIESSVEYLQESLEVLRHKEDIPIKKMVLEELGMAHRCIGSSKSIDYYQQSYSIAQEMNHQLGKSTSLGGLGHTYTMFEEPAKALHCLTESLGLNQHVHHKIERIIPLNGLSVFYDRQGNHGKACEFAEEQLRVSREINYKYAEANALCTLGKISHDTHDYHSSLESLAEAKRIMWDCGLFPENINQLVYNELIEEPTFGMNFDPLLKIESFIHYSWFAQINWRSRNTTKAIG